METPAQTLASKITDRLTKEGLIDASAAKVLQSKLAEGKLRAEDWQLPIETAGQKKAVTL